MSTPTWRHGWLLGGLLVVCLVAIDPLSAQTAGPLAPATDNGAADVEDIEELQPNPSSSSSPAVVDHWNQLQPTSVTGALFAPGSAVRVNPRPSQPTPPPKPAAPKYPTVDVTGFFQLDAAWFDQDGASLATLGDIQDLNDFRRARLAAKGQVAENFGYYLEMDFAFPGRPSFMDVWVEAQQLSFGNLRIGQFRQPFSMEAIQSVRDLLFLERGLPFAFIPFRQTGVMASGNGFDDSVAWALAGYRFQADPFGGVFGDAGYGLSTRVSSALVHAPDDNLVVHVGGSYSYNRPANGSIQFRQTPEIGQNFGVPGPVPFFVDTGAVAANSVGLYGLEAAFSLGSLWIQSEAIAAQIDQSAAGTSTAWLSGMYAQISYVLTGEVHPYNTTTGVFGRVKPNCNVGPDGFGAWEVAARYSYIDLNDAQVLGGRLSDFTAGLNWYLNGFTKLQFNYIHAFLDDPVFDKSGADVFAVRAQLDF